MSKKILLNPDKNQFIKYYKYEKNVSVPLEVMYLLKVLKTSENKSVSSAALTLFDFFDNCDSRYGNYNRVPEGSVADFTHPVDKPSITFVSVSDYDKYIYSNKRNYSNQNSVIHQSDQEYLNNILDSQLQQSPGTPNLCVKIARITDMAEMTDNTAYLVTKKFSNKKFSKIPPLLDCVEQYIAKNDFKQLNYLKVCYEKGGIAALTHYKNEHVIDQFKVMSNKLKECIKEILEAEIDFAPFIEHDWNGNLEDESVIDNKKSYYIIATNKWGKEKDEGFIGLKSVYNRGNSNSYTFTIVKDLKNALLFTDDNIYDIGYFEILDKMYISGDVLKIENPKSKLGERINIFVDKKVMIESLKNNDLPVQSAAPRRVSKL